MFGFLQKLLTPQLSPETTKEALDADMMKWYGELEARPKNELKREPISVEVQTFKLSEIPVSKSPEIVKG